MTRTAPFLQHSFQKATQYLPVMASGVVCAIELKRVEKIVSLMALELVPSAPEYLAGAFNYQGAFVPVIDLALRVGHQTPSLYDINSSVVLCETMETGSLVGLIVSSVSDVIDVSYSELQLAPEFSNRQSPFTACFKVADEACFLLNSDVLLDSSLSAINAVTPDEIKQAIEQKYNEQ